MIDQAFLLSYNQLVNKIKVDEHGWTLKAFPTKLKSFTRIAKYHPKPQLKGHCYSNALFLAKNRNFRLVVGTAISKTDATRQVSLGKMSWNPLFRGYSHAWNLNAPGEVVDST